MMAVYLIAFLFQQNHSTKEILNFSTENMSGEEGRQWEWIEHMQFAIQVPLLDTMAEGDMDKFEKYLLLQRSVPGLQESTLYDADGRIVNSTDPSRKRKELPGELKETVLRAGKKTKRRTETSFEIYEPLRAEKRCIECHVNNKEGDIRGVMAMRFSADELKAAEQTWKTFEDSFKKSNLVASAISAIGLVLAVGIIIIMSVRYLVTVPIRNAAGMLKDISEGEGDLTKRLPITSDDEIGEMATYFNNFVEKLQGIVVHLVGNTNTLTSSANELTSISIQTGQAGQSMSTKAHDLAAAADQASANTESVAANMEQTSMNISSVAAATEEMSATVGEIAANSEKARAISGQATEQAQAVSAIMQQLGSAAQEIGKVTENITRIASQTNLLALNATIEAASAGEAGRGFAVVAGEIKELSRQTAAATEDIKEKITGVQNSTNGAIAGIEKISGVIDDVGSIIVDIAAAIGEQASVTKSVAGNITQASVAVKEANERIAQTATVSKSMAHDITEVVAAAADIRRGGEQVQTSTGDLSKVTEQLNATVGQFKV